MSDRTTIEITRIMRDTTPKKRWRAPRRDASMADALGAGIFVLIAGGGWLMMAAADAGVSAPAAPITVAAME